MAGWSCMQKEEEEEGEYCSDKEVVINKVANMHGMIWVDNNF